MHNIPAELLAKIAANIRVMENGCHEWRCHTRDKTGAPVVYIPDRNPAKMSVRLALWRAAHPDEARQCVRLAPTCGNPRCVRLADGHVVDAADARVAAKARREQERAQRKRERQERREERERQHGHVVSEWSAYSAHPTRPDPDVVLPEPEHPFFKPQPAVHKCATGIHRLPTIDAECDMCRVITVGRDAALRRHITF